MEKAKLFKMFELKRVIKCFCIIFILRLSCSAFLCKHLKTVTHKSKSVSAGKSWLKLLNNIIRKIRRSELEVHLFLHGFIVYNTLINSLVWSALYVFKSLVVYPGWVEGASRLEESDEAPKQKRTFSLQPHASSRSSEEIPEEENINRFFKDNK